LVEFLELFAPFSRKTLGAISKMIDKRFATECPMGDEMMKFDIPEEFKKKRLEELNWKNLESILIS